MPLKVLIIHNRYRMAGGEESVVATESNLLRAFGHHVEQYYESNEQSFRCTEILDPVWSFRSVRRLREVMNNFKPDVVHCHNIYYRISPAVYWLCSRLGIPSVQTLHNFRIGCLNARLMRDGEPCELCLNGFLTHRYGMVRGCFQQSRIKSTALALSLYTHHNLGTFKDRVTKYIALSEFARTKHLLAGVPAAKIIVKPNCVYPDPGPKGNAGLYGLFVGRLEADKGIGVLLQAAALAPDVPFLIVGDGPLQKQVRETASTLKNVQYAGSLLRDDVLKAMKSAKFLIFPSLAYENFPMTIAEAFSVGLPVIASKRGAAAEIVQNRLNGLLFEPGSATELARCIHEAWRSDNLVEKMGNSARASYEQKYSGQCTHRQLMAIYDEAMEQSRGTAGGPLESATF